MKVAAVTAVLLGLAQARVARRSQSAIGGVCFDFGDCILTGQGLVSCDHSGDNGMLFGLLGSCVDTSKAKSGGSSGGFLASLGLGKRHGPDDNDETVVVVVAANATVAAAPMAGMAGMKRHGPDGDDDAVVIVVATNATAMAGMPMN